MTLQKFGSKIFGVRGVIALTAPITDGLAAPLSARMIAGRLAVGALLLFLVYSSAGPVRRALKGEFPKQINAYHSTDAYIQAVTGTPHASQRIIDLMTELPSNKPLLIFEREKDSASSLLGMALAYLAWPREVRFESVEGPRCDAELARIDPASVSAVAFCDLPTPAWIPGGMRLGERGKLIAFAGATEKPR